MADASKMPARIWATGHNYGLQMWSVAKWPIYNNAEYIRADLVEQMAAALRFYSGIHEPGLSNPNEGPWGVNSTDFGERARLALQAYEAAK